MYSGSGFKVACISSKCHLIIVLLSLLEIKRLAWASQIADKGMGIKEAVSLIKGPKDKPIKLALLRVNEEGKKEKINVRLVRDTFKVPNKEYLYEGDMRRQLEFFFPENLKEISPENELSPNKKKGTSI